MLKISQSIYIHFPFCRSKCAYCDFYSAARGYADMPRYVEALGRELAMRRHELAASPQTVYLGGGTPSMAGCDLIDRLFEVIAPCCDPASLAEATIEANPEDITPETLARYRHAGINRVSIGIQSFDAGLLAAVSRRHSPADAEKALNLLAGDGWNYSADLIYGLPGQTPAMWTHDLRRLLSWRPPHFSAYLLSYEENTPLYHSRQLGKVREATDGEATQMYDILCDEAARAGYRHYEISNFALPGFEAIHNSAYWDGTPYLGLGAGAHSLGADGLRRFNPPDLGAYIEAIEHNRLFCQTDYEDDANRANDTIITALRTADGLDSRLIPQQFRAEFDSSAATFVADGRLCRTTSGSLRIPEKHWLKADAIIRDLIVGC